MKYTLAQTQALATELARDIQGGEVFALYGQLGSGKTTFVQAFGLALGITRVTSPTFVLMNLYTVANHPTVRRLCHIDAYRLPAPSASVPQQQHGNLGLEEYIHDPHTVCLIEWADRIEGALPRQRTDIFFRHTNAEDANTRDITIQKYPA
ncbi:MAG: tRNA (adenosine(37)-N6)-threonylcarbamoyltransferase complex ATPase subunit type 1 TsaE [Candidatus Kerfeldbacteria bacterium RIFCSPHIGHO2_12_FULL_48_17]|uniref:tRNA threonylcarbamoyladenosine biosynthesis protein TsaE n=1 Tax=Candidatus Kerfeldbacteria bacterium RIFCSPHIGHO2_12_FULL_48_17 TaxID=1798542 RepID=A0A1G2BA69_9BACT|nr:MAG: tRNA (adenosine(37)-N6)-threonylcarbamoyltransferase complex ATPase subunit type 1 TsaE [Candidatus Kerfeldbacteria bacterium RIFCSPHIGHO2_12_FULL_48_17]